MPQETRDRPGSRGAATNKEAAQDKEHRDRKRRDCVSSFSEGCQAFDSEPSQGKAVGKNHENRQAKSEEPESIILGIECLVEGGPPLSGREVRGTHLISASRNRAVTEGMMMRLALSRRADRQGFGRALA